MFLLTPSLCAADARLNLDRLIATGSNAGLFQTAIKSLNTCFSIYSATCPAPFIAPDLIVTPEIRHQSELYLPIAEIAGIFNHLYRQSLTYPPVLSSTPFHKTLSWADVFFALPQRFQLSANPALLLEALLSDREMLAEFLFASFLPRRFYGCSGRYPGQVEFIRKWLTTLPLSRSHKGRGQKRLRCLDAACGTGEDSYGLANLLMEAGFSPEEFLIEGWTLEPLEVWAATFRQFPHNRQREVSFRRETAKLIEQGYLSRICFRSADLTEILCPQGDFGQFDLILCNGLLGGPIIHETEKMERLLSTLLSLLVPGGILLVADNFHDGWKLKFGISDLKLLFSVIGLQNVDAGEGICGLKR